MKSRLKESWGLESKLCEEESKGGEATETQGWGHGSSLWVVAALTMLADIIKERRAAIQMLAFQGEGRVIGRMVETTTRGAAGDTVFDVWI